MNKKLNLVTLLLATMMFSLVAVPNVAFAIDLTHYQLDTIGQPMDVDPAWAYDTGSSAILINVYETLLYFNYTNMDSYIPILSTNWVGEIIDETSPEGIHWANRWTFTIRDNVYFHTDGVNDIPGEGALLTPADIEYSFERLLITDCSTGPAWMVFEPLFGGYWMGDVNATLFDLGTGSLNATTGWNTECDEAIDHAIESNATHVWFNLFMAYEPWLQIVAQNWGSVLNQAWCVWHGDWPGPVAGDSWADYWDPLISPLVSSTSSPGPHNEVYLGTGPYMFDYWDLGVGGSWSIIKNPNYWRGWAIPYNPPEWGTPPVGGWIQGHLDRFTSNYIPEWSTRRLRFLGGVVDSTYVPRQYMGQVDGQPGVECIFPLPQLACDGCFFSAIVDDSSTHIGVVQPNGTFSAVGAPPNMFNDTTTRLAFTHMFDYATYLYSSFLNESIAPVTPVVPGLSYYDPSIGVAEEPTLNQRKELGITGEPPGTLAYNLTKAVEYLQAAWGGALWANGFTIDLVYNEGNIPRLNAALLLQDALNDINAVHGTSFTTNIVSIPWSIYKLEWRARQLPYFIVGWLADYPDAHNFAQPFMHSVGAFSRWQGILGVTDIPNAYVDGLIEAGIATVTPAERQGNYTLIQQAYVDQAFGLTISQPTGRRWQRDWVEGWYYNPIRPAMYIYDNWKLVSGTIYDVDVAVTGMTDAQTAVSDTISGIWGAAANGCCIEVGIYEDPSCGGWFPGNTAGIAINVTVTRNAGGAITFVPVVIGLGRINLATGYATIIDTDTATLGVGGTYTAAFVWDTTTDPDIAEGNYTIYSLVLTAAGYANDVNMANNYMNSTDIEACRWNPDTNIDGIVELGDWFIVSSAVASYPGHERWDPCADVNEDDYVDLMDFYNLSINLNKRFGIEVTC